MVVVLLILGPVGVAGGGGRGWLGLLRGGGRREIGWGWSGGGVRVMVVIDIDMSMSMSMCHVNGCVGPQGRCVMVSMGVLHWCQWVQVGWGWVLGGSWCGG